MHVTTENVHTMGQVEGGDTGLVSKKKTSSNLHNDSWYDLNDGKLTNSI